MPPLRVLILGGTCEASALADQLACDGRFAPVLSLAGRTQSPRLPAIAWRTGGFGGVSGLIDYLQDNGIQALVVATHPFAAQIRRHAVAAAHATDIPLLTIERPAWFPGDGDHWVAAASMTEAAQALGPNPRRVLLTVGRQDLVPFAAARWHAYTVRSVDAPAPESLPVGAEIIIARGPFDAAAERQLLVDRRIDVIVTKNSGGTATQAKLLAARELGLPVIMVARPVASGPSGSTAAKPADVLKWLEGLHQSNRVRI